MRKVAVLLTLLFVSNSYAKETTLEVIEAKEQVMCQLPETKIFMPCALMLAVVRKVMGGGCGERSCPVRL